MGYESRLYVVEKTDLSGYEHPDHKHAQVVAMFDLSKAGLHSSMFRPTDCYIYASDGNTEIVDDCYGDPLKELTIPEVITILEKLQSECPGYRRWQPCISLLKSFDVSQWRNLVVLHYGY